MNSPAVILGDSATSTASFSSRAVHGAGFLVDHNADLDFYRDLPLTPKRARQIGV